MKYIFLFLILIAQLQATVIKSPIVSVNEEENTATISIDRIDVGMSGFIVHNLDSSHSSILKNITVTGYDKDTKIATLKMDEYDVLYSSALPQGQWKVEAGDIAVLAFGYTRAILIAPNEDIYFKITKKIDQVQWIHPDIFATTLSLAGHPTPLKSDFYNMSDSISLGLLFIYLEKKVFTVDSKSFTILNISDAPFVQESEMLPFYSRVEEIDASWWGEGSNRMKTYEPHYYELLVKNNKNNKDLYEIIKNSDKKLSKLLENFEIKE